MSALFPPWSNTLSRLTVFCLVAGLTGLVTLLFLYVRSPYFIGEQDPIDQPIQFDHRHHVVDDGIDCRFCHTTVETSASAGLPSTAVCMGCHAQVWNKSPLLEPVRASFFSGRSIVWNRVHHLPDFVYFNHSIHVRKGIGCVSCHGRVDEMAQITQVAPLTMGWCLDCHRHPEPNVRPREEITHLAWDPEGAPARSGVALASAYDVRTRTSCTACHR